MASVIQAGTASNTALTLSSDTSGELQLKTNSGSTTAMTLTTAGNVGIGTTSPSYPLHVSSSGNNTKARFTNGTTTLDLYCGGAAVYTGTANSATSWEYANNNTYIAAFVNSAERMRIDSSGNVGIGNTVATTIDGQNGAGNLVVGGGSAAEGITIYTGTASNGVLCFADGTSGTTTYRGYISYEHANDALAFATAAVERMRITSAGNVGIGTSSPDVKLQISGGTSNSIRIDGSSFGGAIQFMRNGSVTSGIGNTGFWLGDTTSGVAIWGDTGNDIRFYTNGSATERMRITSGGDVAIGTTDSAATRLAASSGNGTVIQGASYSVFTRNADASAQAVMAINTTGVDSKLIVFYAQGTEEGNISVSGTTVSYNGGHLSRWAQMLTKPELLKGTVMSNLDEMNEYVDAEGNPVANEQLNKVKVSDVEGDVNVAGVFVNWSHDEAHNVDEINMAMTGDMIIRIAQGVVVQKGDLLMSAGDGTAKPQGDDIVRSKTVAKVTSNHVTCTYEDGSYCVPCVLMAC